MDSSSNDDDVDLAAAELKEALSHPSLETLPLLVLANKQDVQGARSADEVSNKSFSSLTSKCIKCILLRGVFLLTPLSSKTNTSKFNRAFSLMWPSSVQI